jgi:hypothetical protein
VRALYAWALDYDLGRVSIEIPSHAGLGFGLIGTEDSRRHSEQKLIEFHL